VLTPLRGADGHIYAQAQGNVAIGGVGAVAAGNRAVINHLSAGRITGGAIVEREVPSTLGQGAYVHYEMRSTDFGTAQRIVEAINREIGSAVARPLDGRVIRVNAPEDPGARVAFMGRIENLTVQPVRGIARVIVNPRTGSVVMNQMVSVESFAVAHGALSVIVTSEPVISQPGPFAGGQTVVAASTDIQIEQPGGALMHIQAGANLADIVKAINALGANPQDLVSILQAMKAAGALRAELEII
jgi:flagellar P-ring protein precursor FlgI